jgi:hypothetical protein
MDTTKFPKSIKGLADYGHPVLKQSSNKKIARRVSKGRFAGYMIRTLTLTERDTCPRSCLHWDTCYGNNMPFAHRLDHRDESLLVDRIRADLEAHDWSRAGMLVRLHVLGDFFSVSYVEAWGNFLEEFPGLACWGYTAREPAEHIGIKIREIRYQFPYRFAIRWSNRPGAVFSANSLDLPNPGAGVIPCPEQTGKTKGCGFCTLCWDQPARPIGFATH